MRRLRWVGVCLAAALETLVLAADEVIGLPELAVRAAGMDEPVAPGGGSNLAGALWVPAVRLAPQGSGAQADLSIRGSPFSGAGLAVGGLSLRHPQTEHFNAELPLPLELFAAPRVVTGLEQPHVATGHLVGSVAAEFAPVADTTQAVLGLSEAGGHEERLFVARAFADTSWGASVFGGNADMPGRDYAHNTAETRAGGLHLQYRRAEDQVDTAAAVQDRSFGARGFYGVSPTLFSEEETLDMLWLSTWRHELPNPGDFTRIGAFSERFRDEYILNDLAPDAYRNEHCTWATAAAADGRLSNGQGSGAAWRAFVEDERIASEGLVRGSATAGLGEHTRQRFGLMLLPFQEIGPLTLEAGGQAVFFTTDAPAPLALAGIRWAISAAQEGYVSYTETVRQPSFTELDYESPASLGNQGLENEESGEYEAGLRSQWAPILRTRLAAFRRTTEHTVDWLRQTPNGRWLATDVGDVRTHGLEAEATCQTSRNLKVTLFGQVLRKQSEADYYASRYVFDYPEERLGVGLSWRLTDYCELRSDQAVLWYAPNPARGSDRCGSVASLGLVLRPPSLPYASVTLACANLFDDELEVYPGQRPAGRTFSGALTVTW